MKHCSLFCAGPWPFLILPLLLLLPVLYFTWHPIEELVARNVGQDTARDYPWAEIKTFYRGREVLLAGEAPSSEAIEGLLAKARGAEGVNSVRFVGDVGLKREPKSLADPSFRLSQEDGELVITGLVDSADSVNILEQTTQKILGNTRIRNTLKSSAEVAAAPDMSNIILAFSKIDESGAIHLSDGQLRLTGQVSSSDEKKLIESIASRGFSGPIDNQLQIVAPPCQVTIRGLLDGSKINFTSGSAEINSDSDELLNKISEAAKECEASLFEVVGHTDATGDEEFNKDLSQRRADAVVNKLTERGLDKSRFKTRGAGSTEPSSDNSTSAGRANNRRIEFRVTN